MDKPSAAEKQERHDPEIDKIVGNKGEEISKAFTNHDVNALSKTFQSIWNDPKSEEILRGLADKINDKNKTYLPDLMIHEDKSVSVVDWQKRKEDPCGRPWIVFLDVNKDGTTKGYESPAVDDGAGDHHKLSGNQAMDLLVKNHVPEKLADKLQKE